MPSPRNKTLIHMYHEYSVRTVIIMPEIDIFEHCFQTICYVLTINWFITSTYSKKEPQSRKVRSKWTAKLLPAL